MRLIDADALKAEFTGNFKNEYTKAEIHALIDLAPTVATDTNVLGKWISVKDRLPETRHVVLVYTPEHKNIWAASIHEDWKWYTWSAHGREYLDPDWYGQISHWMPLPEPPKEESDD